MLGNVNIPLCCPILQPGYWGLGNTVYGCLPCDCDIGGALRTEYDTTVSFLKQTTD